MWGYNQIESAKISSKIKYIAPYAFYVLYDFGEITFSKNSELLSIGKNAFCVNRFKKHRHSKSVLKIEKKTLRDCRYLKSVDFVKNSELESIKSDAFCHSSIDSLTIQANVKNLNYCWCSYVPKLTFLLRIKTLNTSMIIKQ